MKRLFMVFAVLCVMQAAIAARAESFTDNGDGTVTKMTGNGTYLTWQQGEPGAMYYYDALTYCEGLSLGGQTDWRLPNISELESIVVDDAFYPTINTAYFPNAMTYPYWSSTTYAYNKYEAWVVDFYKGNVAFYNKNSVYYVRCVRGEQCNPCQLYFTIQKQE